jgi:hypothetical protein
MSLPQSLFLQRKSKQMHTYYNLISHNNFCMFLALKVYEDQEDCCKDTGIMV